MGEMWRIWGVWVSLFVLTQVFDKDGVFVLVQFPSYSFDSFNRWCSLKELVSSVKKEKYRVYLKQILIS